MTAEPAPAGGPPVSDSPTFRLERGGATSPRAGLLATAHGVVRTPAFMPVGTAGSVKGLSPAEIRAAGTQILLANTYHLMLRPGAALVRELGGLHAFMGWDGAILTDSGGYQMVSLKERVTITEEGVAFRSHLDGRAEFLTPERAMEIQADLGPDVAVTLDHAVPLPAPADEVRDGAERTLRWAELCVEAHARPAEQALFGIVQGGTDLELRARCAEHLIRLDLPGYALGGLAVGEGFEAMKAVLAGVTALLPSDKPRYLMGVGFPRDIVAAVTSGIDMFDCVLPTRNGRNAYAFTKNGAIRIRNAKFTQDTGPIEEGCDCYACKTFTRGAIRHYFFASEMLGPMLVSVHNVRFFQRLMEDIRRAIAAGTFDEFRRTDPRCLLGPAE